MTRIRLALLSVVVPALCALSVDDEDSDLIVAPDERTALLQYVESLDWQCDLQIDDLASVIPADQVDALRREHYVWRLGRDLQCKEIGRDSSNELAEAECLSKMTSEYFDRREVEISEFEAELARKLGIEKPQSGEKELPGIP